MIKNVQRLREMDRVGIVLRMATELLEVSSRTSSRGRPWGTASLRLSRAAMAVSSAACKPRMAVRRAANFATLWCCRLPELPVREHPGCSPSVIASCLAVEVVQVQLHVCRC